MNRGNVFDCIFCGKSSAVNLGNKRPEGICTDCFNKSKVLKMKKEIKVTKRVAEYGMTVEDAWGTITVLIDGKPLKKWPYDIGFGGPSREDVMKNDVQRFMTEYIEIADRRKATG